MFKQNVVSKLRLDREKTLKKTIISKYTIIKS